MIKLESATRESLETLRKYFDEAFAKLEPGSKTPMRDWALKMRERGNELLFKKKDAKTTFVPEGQKEFDDAFGQPVVAPAVEPVVAPVERVVAPVEPVVEPAIEPALQPAVEPVVAPVVEPVIVPEPVDTVVPPVVDTVVAPAAPPKRTRRRNVQPGIEEKLKKLEKSGIVNQGGMRKKKLRTRRGVKQNVRRSSGRKNRSNRTDTYSSRRTEVDARGDELGL